MIFSYSPAKLGLEKINNPFVERMAAAEAGLGLKGF